MNSAGVERRPVMIHRAVLGSVERMLGILIEHYSGKWPFWLSPRQVYVIPVHESCQAYAAEVYEKIKKAGCAVELSPLDVRRFIFYFYKKKNYNFTRAAHQ